jgi:hypothetical protein
MRDNGRCQFSTECGRIVYLHNGLRGESMIQLMCVHVCCATHEAVHSSSIVPDTAFVGVLCWDFKNVGSYADHGSGRESSSEVGNANTPLLLVIACSIRHVLARFECIHPNLSLFDKFSGKLHVVKETIENARHVLSVCLEGIPTLWSSLEGNFARKTLNLYGCFRSPFTF